MIIVKDSPLNAGWMTWQLQPGRWSLIVVAKATFDIPLDGGTCTLAEEQDLVTGDHYEDDDVERPLRTSNDLAITKPQGETYLAGTCHAPHGRPVTSLLVAFRVGAIAKELAVIGDRYWMGGLLGGMSEPAPFTSMSLSWARAFGGRASKANPLGKGLDPVVIEGEERYPLPNIEDRTRMLRSSQAAPEPHGAFPIPPHWPRRTALAGTFDALWQRARWPFFPDNFQTSYFNVAPFDQRIVGFWRGDEPIDLVNLHPERPKIRARLPGLAARVLVHESADRPTTHEVGLVLDTLVVDADALKVHAVWRGKREVRSQRYEELETLFLTHDSIGALRSKDELDGAYAAELARRNDEERGFLAEPMPPAGGALA